MVSWSDLTKMYSERIRIAIGFHVNTDAGGGATTGYCCSCNEPYPCQTAHVLNGWGMGDGQDGDGAECYVTGWCTHASTTVEKIYD